MDNLNRENINETSGNTQKTVGWDITRDIYETKQQIVDNRIRERKLKKNFDEANSFFGFTGDIDELLQEIEKCQNEAIFLSSRLRSLEEQQREIAADKMWEELDAKHKTEVAEHRNQVTSAAMSELDEEHSEFFAPKTEAAKPATNNVIQKKLSRVEKAQMRVDAAQRKVDAAIATLNKAIAIAGPFDKNFTRIEIARAEKARADLSLRQYTESDGARFVSAQKRVAAAADALKCAIDAAAAAGTPIKKYKKVQTANAKKILAEVYLRQCIEWANNAKKAAAQAAQRPVETPAERAAREAQYMKDMQAKINASFEKGCRW